MPEAAPAPQTGKAPAPAPSTKAGNSKQSEGVDATSDAPKKPRAPRKDYGYAVTSTIKVDKEKEQKFTGQRKAWYEMLLTCDGKTVNDFEGKAIDKQAPRGWMRFFCQEGYATLTRVKPVEADAEPKK